MINENVKKRFANTYKFSNHDISKFILLLRKDIYPYGYMKHHYQKKRLLLLKNIFNADYAHAGRGFKDFQTKKNWVNINICMIEAIQYC